MVVITPLACGKSVKPQAQGVKPKRPRAATLTSSTSSPSASFTRVPFGLITDRRLSPSERVLVIGLFRLGLNGKPKALGVKDVAAATGFGISQTKRLLESLSKKGILRGHRRRGTTAVWELCQSWPAVPWAACTPSFFALEVPATTRLVLAGLLLCRKKGCSFTYVKPRTLARLLGLDERTARRCLNQLYKAGLIGVEKVRELGLRVIKIHPKFLIDVKDATDLEKPTTQEPAWELAEPQKSCHFCSEGGAIFAEGEEGVKVDLHELLPRFFRGESKFFQTKEKGLSAKGEERPELLEKANGNGKDLPERQTIQARTKPPVSDRLRELLGIGEDLFHPPQLPAGYEHLLPSKRENHAGEKLELTPEVLFAIRSQLENPPNLPEGYA